MKEKEALPFNSIVGELNNLSDRGAAVLAGGLVEAQLEELLLKAMVDHKDIKNFIERGSFATNMMICFGLGLIPDDLYHDLKLLKKIRNRFAHETQELSFDKVPISGDMENFKGINKFPQQIQGSPFIRPDNSVGNTIAELPNRMKFSLAVAGISTTLHHIMDETSKSNISMRFYIDPTPKTT